jgi:glycosyltransferase involved in cell wall biosynthesis
VELQFSLIIPVFNRPNEIDELLNSLTKQTYQNDFEVIVVEDGSTVTATDIITKYSDTLNIKYFVKENSGPGPSRNFGMQKAMGNYFVIFDSDCIIPPNYLTEVEIVLLKNYSDAYGGADMAHVSFSTFQKAINYSMTSFLTSGGIRGSKMAIDKFQPRSFNMGISKKAFEVTQGFSPMRIGEDIDLTFRLWENNFETQFIDKASVYHKRRATFQQFFKQTFAFGKTRPLLNEKYPQSAKITYWFPSIFLLLLILSILTMFFYTPLFTWLFAIYFTGIFIDSFIKNKNILVALVSIVTTLIQFAGYGLGFIYGLLMNRRN